jgi:alcohol dehydrogenase class IV
LAAGLDAFCHAIEAATGQRATTEVRDLGFEAAALVHRQLASSLTGDLAARGRLELT